MFALLAALCSSLSLPYTYVNNTTGLLQTAYWDPLEAYIPCKYLPPEAVTCQTKTLKYFQWYFPDVTLPDDGCAGSYNDLNSYGVGICQPLPNIECRGVRLQYNDHVRCYREDGRYSYVYALVSSAFLGFFGADRFYLGYHTSAMIKLVTLGGFGIWYLIDLFMISVAALEPRYGYYTYSY